MKSPLRSISALAGSGLILLTGASIFPTAALAEVLVRAQGRCKLMSGGFESFNGHCTFKHKQAGGTDAYVVKLDDGTDFIFRGPSPDALQVQTYRGIVNVRHKAEPNHDVFIWNDGEQRRLSVRLDQVQNPDVTFEDQPEKVTGASLLGAAVGALIGGLISGNKTETTEAATAGSPVSDLQSLVGVKGRSAEAELTRKGYTFRGADQVGDSSLTYWQQPKTNNCIAVRTTDGRYQSITYINPQACQ